MDLPCPALPLYLWCRDRNDGRGVDPSMRERQPLPELIGRLIGGLPIKRHHRRRHSGTASELRSPAVADRRDLTLVHAAAYGLFESMDRH